ncbi:hypothetical protein FE773_05575 [Caminibacter mediatlanticus TB-2]|uniref:Outer membrane protein beta-barrel domain-containing protein n=1 Tax=Caminibacter mediatlanticus TB-2 TaxID=391592 RepID=A0ABX5VAR3_9BACT|nr:hypothetical protein [Caminibacter mediatlanticus]QCT94664.1 hypothetical protein FE773_05575 [Caminibacter mediatlanticus TB-2]
MIKKFIIFIGTFLFAYQEVYFYNVDLDYKEYVNNQVVDRDYSKFGELVGVGYKYVNFGNLNYGVNIEYAAGKSHYVGGTWSGASLNLTQNNVSILNANIFGGFRYLNFVLGYRSWNRGKSNYEGDYEEVYYWSYFGVRYTSLLKFRNVAFIPEIEYQFAINPKLDIKLGNNPTLNLGETTGAKIELPFIAKYDNLYFKIFYRYQYWHISKSNTYILKINNEEVPIFEPESITINQYLGAGILFKF